MDPLMAPLLLVRSDSTFVPSSEDIVNDQKTRLVQIRTPVGSIRLKGPECTLALVSGFLGII